MPRAVVTGMGVVAATGQTVRDFFDAIVAGRSGITRLSPGVISAENTFVAGQVAFEAPSHWRPSDVNQTDRATQFALVAAKQALDDADLGLSEEEMLRTAVYWGTGLGGATSIEECYRGLFASARVRVRPAAVVLGMNNAAAAHVSMANGLRGPLLNFSTACSSSAASVGEAARAIRHGYADVVVAGGSEALLTYGNVLAWNAMRALAHADPDDPSRSCRPFDARRTGLVLGEGAAALVLESSDRAERRGARIYAELAGYGNASDARDISKPDVDGQVRAMHAALADAQIDAQNVGYINAHGTATQIGDVTETAAIRKAFGARASSLPVSSTKAVHGHLLGGAGALEAVISVMAIHENVIPPTAHLETPDPACDLDYVPGEARRGRLGAVMSNSFGFGGMNSVLVARRY
ncbi:MAG: beta-ketoacyl-[acyl-carrier-protein] synthase family protein [Gemmatimonadaceae bacterium]